MDDTNVTPPPPIPIEETPEIPMEPSVGTPPPSPPMPKASPSSTVIMILVFLILFIAGILLSSYIRPFFSGRETPVPTPTIVAPTPTPVDPFVSWRTSTIAGLSYKLPPDVLAPTCDGAACVSQGTYLPGGTRLTIAPKTVTQSPSSLRGAVITDAVGTAFTSRDATVSAHTAIEFTGTFAGRTSGGYGFTEMHGFMIEVTPTLTLEINHFTPTGVTADFAKDDALFTQILSTLNFSAPPVPATTSGY